MTISAYPLQWPVGWKRTPAAAVKPGHFGKRRSTSNCIEDLTVNEAVQRVLSELQRMAIARDDVVVSTNIPTRLDGLPRGDAKRPTDHGAAVYWEERTGARRCIAVDQYKRVEDNLAAIAATLEAMRAIERHGGAAILARAFTGFTALPAPGAARDWWVVLGVPKGADAAAVKVAYRTLAGQHHPDRGGDPARMAEINAAYRQATGESGHG